ncbi:hypothetical protein Q5P01_011423 [Channa striata]|uniref:Ig-like domain-containing protein n=1 Tax=Channa striata TaxID=64152 RepID=A0AA88MUT1_CHASR|nr:hypothetical protein Q5P01_011423 [Channa striata]
MEMRRLLVKTDDWLTSQRQDRTCVEITTEETQLSIRNVKEEDAGPFSCISDGKQYEHRLLVFSVSARPSSELELNSEAELHCRMQGTWFCMISENGMSYNESLTIVVKVPATTKPSPTENSKSNHKPDSTPCSTKDPLSWWIWVAVGVGCFVVILLMTCVIVLCKRLQRRKKKHLRMKNGRLRPTQYCKCNTGTAAARPQHGRGKRSHRPSLCSPLVFKRSCHQIRVPANAERCVILEGLNETHVFMCCLADSDICPACVNYGHFGTSQPLLVSEMKNLIEKILIFISVLFSTRADEVVYAQVGHDVPLNPPMNNPKLYLNWKFAKHETDLAWRNPLGGKGVSTDEIWKNSLSLSGDSLVISSIKAEQFGTYICKLSQGQTLISTVTIQLRKLSVSAPSPLLPGESLSLSCNPEVPQGQNKPIIHWVNPQNKKVQQKNDLLTVNVVSQDHGQWTCVVSNNPKEHNATVSVVVLGLSQPPLQTVYTSKMSSLTLPCSTHSGVSWEHIKAKDIQKVSWEFSPKLPSGFNSGGTEKLLSFSLETLTWDKVAFKDLKPVGDAQKGNLSLNRGKGREDDRGNYTCQLQFKNGVILKSTVHVEVLSISASPGTELLSGQQLNLTCSAGDQLPSHLQLKWTGPEDSSLKSDPQGPHFTIPEVGTGDSGRWKCELLEGKTHLTSDVIKLKIEPRLSVWMLVTICSAAAIVILILIVVFIFYLRRQRRVRHLRHRLCKCQNPKPKGFYRT